MKIAYFDCFSGVAGDMCIAALLDAGVPFDVIDGPLSKLPIADYKLEASRAERHGIAATQVRVRGQQGGIFRNFFAVQSLIANAEVSDRARETALRIYQRLAEAEAAVHGTDVGHVPFHELGSADTIVDVLGTAIGLDHLDIEQVVASPVATGMGMMRTEHGMLPVPGPAVVELLKGAPIYSQGVPYELTTPTGAAILAATVTRWGDIPPMRLLATGYGAGTRELDIPNVLRLLIGESTEAGDALGPVPAVLLEANIDDMNPEFYEYVIERLLADGAQDAWVTPIVMKRGRPAATLSVLCDPASEQTVRSIMFRETTTLGMRRRVIEKWTLSRESVTVEVAGMTVRVKVGSDPTGVMGAAAEYVDCAQVARETGLPLKQIYAMALEAARALLSSDS